MTLYGKCKFYELSNEVLLPFNVLFMLDYLYKIPDGNITGGAKMVVSWVVSTLSLTLLVRIV
jgi:hypothetical protein